MRNGFRVESGKGVSRKIARLCKDFFHDLEDVTPIQHRIGVLLIPQMALSHSDKELSSVKRGDPVCCGAFASPKDKKRLDKRGLWIENCDCVILIPTKSMDFRRKMEPGLTEEDAKVQFLSDMAHEVGHYTQFRDGKELTEVGIEDITDDLLNGYCRTYSEANV